MISRSLLLNRFSLDLEPLFSFGWRAQLEHTVFSSQPVLCKTQYAFLHRRQIRADKGAHSLHRRPHSKQSRVTAAWPGKRMSWLGGCIRRGAVSGVPFGYLSEIRRDMLGMAGKSQCRARSVVGLWRRLSSRSRRVLVVLA